MIETITFTNTFHNTTVVLKVRDGKISKGQYKRALQGLCPSRGSGCTCLSSMASGRDLEIQDGTRKKNPLDAYWESMRSMIKCRVIGIEPRRGALASVRLIFELAEDSGPYRKGEILTDSVFRVIPWFGYNRKRQTIVSQPLNYWQEALKERS